MHTILVADDSVTILKAVEIVFDKEPFQVVKAGSGAEAIAQAKALRPALVLADHTMGDKSGYDVAEALRGDGIPVMILSSNTIPYDEGRARAAGVVGHVPKPFDCQTLLDRVRNVLGVAATPPGTFAGAPSTPASTGATANMPRPPGIPSAASSMPRPPGGLGGLARPPGTNPGGGLGGSAAVAAGSGAPIAVAASTASTLGRSPTPQPARADLDPFGFSSSLGASAPAPISTVPRAASSASPASPATPATSSNPFSTGLGASTVGTPTPIASTPMSSPPSISAQSSASSSGSESWKTSRSADVSFEISVDSGSASSPPSSQASKTNAPSYVSDSEFLEVADIEVSDIPSSPSLPPVAAAKASSSSSFIDESQKRTDRIDSEALAARMEAEQGSKSNGIKLELATAADIVAEKSATVIAKTTSGAMPSKEAITEEARQIIERVAWEVVPELAETIIREEIQRLLKSRG